MTTQGRVDAAPRCIAIVGPYQSGKTSLLEAILARCGAIERPGRAGATVGDAGPEARAHAMSVEPNVATVSFLGEVTTFVDCPGSVEFAHDARTVLPPCDAAVVVCEADDRKVPALGVILRELEEAGIPRFLFINKIDVAARRVRETLAVLQGASRTPLLLRQIPIWKDGIAVGFIDLALERAFIYREHAASEVVPLPDGEGLREREARFAMLERLADYDDALMENLIGDIEPPRDQVFDDLARELRDRHVVPVLIGAAEHGHGVTRLLKALRHEAPRLPETRSRLGVAEAGPPLAQVMRTAHTTHGGKLSLARMLRGRIAEGEAVVGSGGGATRVAGLVALNGSVQARVPAAEEGAVRGFLKLDAVATGDSFAPGRERPAAVASVAPPEPVAVQALATRDRKDDVRLSGALAKLVEEDPALVVVQDAASGEIRLAGQGAMHLGVALERLAGRHGIAVSTSRPAIGYRETVRVSATARARHKKQTGGHGQFADVTLTVSPRPRGAGFAFADATTGGVVPRQFVGSVEAGVREALRRGALGHPVEDVAVSLDDGAAHAVDSSDAAFQAAARLAMVEALGKADPVLLEPVMAVEIVIPSEALARATALVTGRRGQILGFDARPGWPGWETLAAWMPESEIGDLVTELRSASAGTGTFCARFDHLSELTGRAAEAVRQAAA